MDLRRKDQRLKPNTTYCIFSSSCGAIALLLFRPLDFQYICPNRKQTGPEIEHKYMLLSRVFVFLSFYLSVKIIPRIISLIEWSSLSVGLVGLVSLCSLPLCVAARGLGHSFSHPLPPPFMEKGVSEKVSATMMLIQFHGVLNSFGTFSSGGISFLGEVLAVYTDVWKYGVLTRIV